MLFNQILAGLTLVTALFWFVDRLWFARQRRAAGGDKKPNAVVDFIASLFPVILAVFVVRSFVVEPFRIPSGSMLPTLHIGDFILVNKYDYGLRCPVGTCKLVNIGKPERGDVVVFKYPAGGPHKGEDFIKRIIGIPGDHIKYINDHLWINGKSIPLVPDGGMVWQGVYWRIYEETIDGRTNKIMLNPNLPHKNWEGTVPPDSYFVMGDNRDDSDDSRYWGFVPAANLRGRAFFIWMSWEYSKFRPDWSRIGKIIPQ